MEVFIGDRCLAKTNAEPPRLSSISRYIQESLSGVREPAMSRFLSSAAAVKSRITTRRRGVKSRLSPSTCSRFGQISAVRPFDPRYTCQLFTRVPISPLASPLSFLVRRGHLILNEKNLYTRVFKTIELISSLASFRTIYYVIYPRTWSIFLFWWHASVQLPFIFSMNYLLPIIL